MPAWRLDPWPYPRWIAHRGAGKLAPENTLAAFRVGASHGYRAFECDVKTSSDGELFLLHDSTLERSTDGGERIAGDLPWAELARLDAGSWHSRAFAGEPIPHFGAIARYCLRNGYALNVEIKPTPGQEVATGRAVAAAVQRLWSRSVDKPLLSSFRPEALQGAMEAASALPRALLLDSPWTGWESIADALGVVAVVTQFKLMDAAMVERLHAAGRRALCYTVNDPLEAQRLIALGVDGLITDAVDRFSPV